MIATVVIALLIAAAFGLAVRHVMRRGVCASCDQRDGCAGAGSCCVPGATAARSSAARPVDLGMPGVRPGR